LKGYEFRHKALIQLAEASPDPGILPQRAERAARILRLEVKIHAVPGPRAYGT